ncbi:MAG: glycosyltransferase family 39 protein [bacterium]
MISLSFIKGNKLKLGLNLGLFFIFIFIIIAKIPFLFDPPWYSDEGIYAAVAHEMNSGELLYKDVWDNKPPIIYYTYLIGIKLFNNPLFFARFLTVITAIISTILFYKIIKKVFINKKYFIPVFLFALFFSTPFLEGNIANAENYYALFSVAGLYFLLQGFDKKKYLFLFGLMYGIGVMIKIHPLFEFIALFIFLILSNLKKEGIVDYFKKDFKYLIYPIIGLLIPFIFFSLVFIFQGNFTDFINTLLSQGTNYIKNDYNNIIDFLIGSLTGKTILLITSIVIISYLYFKKNIFKNDYFLLIILLFIFSLYSVFLSGRIYIHYLLEIVCPSILLVIYFINYISGKRNTEKILYYLLITFIFLSLITPFAIFVKDKAEEAKSKGRDLWSYSSYYLYHYIDFGKKVSGNITEAEYNSQFDGNINRLYELVNRTNSLKNKNIFVLDDIPWYYVLSDSNDSSKYVVYYHLGQEKVNLDQFLNNLNAEYILTNDELYDKYDVKFTNYIKENYTLEKTFEIYKIYKKNS